MNNTEIKEIIRYHINNKMILNIERIFCNETDITQGFPIIISKQLLLMTVINDFHDEGFAILKLSDISDAYSKESEVFYEKICISENIGTKIPDYIKDITDLRSVVKQLQNYKGYVSIQCENQIETCSFYLGKIDAVEQDGVIFRDIDTDGVWDDEVHKILYDKITKITFEDYYSKMYYKYTAADISHLNKDQSDV